MYEPASSSDDKRPLFHAVPHDHFLKGSTMTTIPNSLRQALTGISGILVTPFDANDKIDPERLEPVMTRAIAANVDILVVNGNTSEFYALQAAEAQAMKIGRAHV